MYLTLLLVLSCSPVVLADDWEDFTNNLATDLAPLITLFGERLTKQFLSESIGLLDNFIFALSPLGVLTAVVSVIRIRGSSSLKAFVGRAQEGPAEAESELLPCVSESTAELFNDGGISRVFGRPKILEIIAWEKKDAATGEKSTHIGTLRQALQERAWLSTETVLPDEEQWDPSLLATLDIPNLSLNKGIKRRDQFWFYCVAILGAALQTGVIIYAAITVFVFPQSFQVNDKAVDGYAFPFYAIGTILLFIGMLSCAILIERSSKQYYFAPACPSKIYWLQPGNQNVGEQVFNAFLAESTMTKGMKYIKSTRVKHDGNNPQPHNIDHRVTSYDDAVNSQLHCQQSACVPEQTHEYFSKYRRQNAEIYLAITTTLLGFVLQFVGERGLHASVILAQLGSTFVMSVLRTCLRTERMAPHENKFRHQREVPSHRHHELDSLTFHLETIQEFKVLSPWEKPSYIPLPNSASKAIKVVDTRVRLAEITSSKNSGSSLAWNHLYTRQVAKNLAETIQKTMEVMSGWDADYGQKLEFKLWIECRWSPSESAISRHEYPVIISQDRHTLRWSAEVIQLEAIIGLWTWSLRKSQRFSATSRDPKLHRRVGLSANEAGTEEADAYFHKWIFRETEAKMGRLDACYRLLDSFATSSDSDLPSSSTLCGEEYLVVETNNDLETMVAQDIYIQFLSSALENVRRLGGDVDVVPGPQGSLSAHSDGIASLVHTIETGNLGSREDALLCVVPVLRQRGLLPILAANSANIIKRVDDYIRRSQWKEAFRLVRWICERSVSSEFEDSIYSLANLCRRAILEENGSGKQEGITEVHDLLRFDIRARFFETRRSQRPQGWMLSQSHQIWWHSFITQLGWVLWNISDHVPNTDGLQAMLDSLQTPRQLPEMQADEGTDDPTRGMRVLERWLTYVDSDIEFEREVPGYDDTLGFEWALNTHRFTILYFFLAKWAELGPNAPRIAHHAYLLASKNHCQWACEVLRRHGVDIEAKDRDGRSVLVALVLARDFEGTLLLLKHGADVNGKCGQHSMRPLDIAANEGYDDFVEMLLQHGAEIENRARNAMSALYWACSNNQASTVRVLLSHGADINSIGPQQATPLLTAVMDGHTQTVEILLEKGAKVNARDERNDTAVMLAARFAPIEILELLIISGADTELRDSHGMTALDMVTEYPRPEAAEILRAARLTH